MSRRARVAAWAVGLVVVLVVGGTAGWRLTRDRHTCGDTVTSIPGSRSSSPFLDAAGRKQQPDAQRDRAVASLGSAPAPFGPVVGAVGYDYEQWAQISAYDQGIGIRTRDNPDFTMLDDHTLEPRWSVQVSTKRSAYDASTQTYLVATLPRKGAPDLVALDASTGARRWCTTLTGPHVGGSDPFATEMLGGGGVVALGPGRGTSSGWCASTATAGSSGPRGRCRRGRLPRPARQGAPARGWPTGLPAAGSSRPR